MGQSTDANLVYGYVWDDQRDLLDEKRDGEGWEAVAARKRGIANPWNAYPQEIQALPYAEQQAKHHEWLGLHRAEINTYFDSLKTIREEYGCETDFHCSGEYPIPIIKIADAGIRASRGDAKRVHSIDLAIDPEWDNKLQKFITDLEIDTSEAHGPGWFLVSWWG